MSYFFEEQPISAGKSYVWVVYLDGEPHNPIMGVFDDPDKADDFAESLAHIFPERLLTSQHEVNHRYNASQSDAITRLDPRV